jgi:molybdopterin molybdotransferase
MTTMLETVSCLDDYDPESLPVERARALTRELVEPVAGTQRLFLREALGRVLAEDVISPIEVPAHDNSAMDGYAVRAADVAAGAETRLALAGTAFAGQPFTGAVVAGQCVRIMTGAVVPHDCDAVVVQEVVRRDGDAVFVPPGQKTGQNIRRVGEDVRAGAAALPAGHLLRPADLGLLASLGIVEVVVRRRLRVAVFSTGDELVSLGSQPLEGQIFDSNRYTLFGMLTRLGCDVMDMGVVRDDPAALERALRTAADNADAILTSGGVSVGEADFMRELMGRLGEVLFWKIAVKPGRPMAFGRIGSGDRQAVLFGLPGNPVAVMVTFYQFVRGALLKMMGMDPIPALPTLQVPCADRLKKQCGRTEYQRGELFLDDGGWRVRASGGQGSAMLHAMVRANCFIVLEQDRGTVEPGETVAVQLLEGLV